jgi:hypothetical protein
MNDAVCKIHPDEAAVELIDEATAALLRPAGRYRELAMNEE